MMTIGVSACPIEKVPIECPAAIDCHRVPALPSIKGTGMVFVDRLSVKNGLNGVDTVPVVTCQLVCFCPMIMSILAYIEIKPVFIVEKLCTAAETSGMISDEMGMLVTLDKSESHLADDLTVLIVFRVSVTAKYPDDLGITIPVSQPSPIDACILAVEYRVITIMPIASPGRQHSYV